jgi:hypothetical protein
MALMRAGFAIAALLLSAAAAAAEPVPYGWAGPPANWRDQAGLWLSGAALAEAAPRALQLDNYWGMRQDPRRPWKGTPRGDGYNGASQAGWAVFSDARWSARAIAIELHDDYAQGARTAEALGERLAAACASASGASACPAAGDYAAAIAAGAARPADQDTRLFQASGLPGPALRPVMRALAMRELGPGHVLSDALIDAGVQAVAYDDLDQSREGFERWRTETGRTPEIERLQAYLKGEGVGEVFPTWQVLRTASDWKGCGAPFDVPPPELWPHIASTLRLVRDQVKPAAPGLEAKSSYRGPWLNVCTGGAERSAHRDFWALDLVPSGAVDRAQLMRRLCPVYAAAGPQLNMGLGFYGGVRFHVDSSSHRQWASYHKVAYGPCATDGAVNPPPDVPPPPEPWPPPPEPR